jgi:sugar phosphate isomerase/epimerase
MTDKAIHSLSTMWSQGRFPRDGHEHDHMPSFAEKAAELGFGHIEINYVIPPAGVEALLASNHVAVSSVHLPCPRVTAPDGRMSDALNLAADDAEERRLAVSYAFAAVDIARRADAKLIVVHLGGVGSAIFPEERELRKLFDEGVRDGEHVEELRRKAAEQRREGHGRYYPNAQQSLAEIAEYASKFGVAIGLENRYHFHEFPNTDEMHELVAAYPADVAGFWLDVGHAEVLERLGLADGKRWLNELAGRCIGTHVHDVDGLADHRAPGHGTADWDHFSEKLPPQIPRIFEINQKIGEDQVAASIPFLRELGVLPRA